MALNYAAKLSAHLFNDAKIAKTATRDGYGRGVVKLGSKNKQVVVLCADVSESTRSQWFQEKFPQRYVELGVAEQNMATVASGMAQAGKIPYMATYAAFSPGRNNEQIRTTIAISNLPVKIISTHGGVSVGEDGATHQALEDVALMRVLPNMTVIVPADAIEAEKAVMQAIKIKGPVYIRLSRPKTPVFTTIKTPFKIGQATFLSFGRDVTIVACGPLVYEALKAAHQLFDQGIQAEVINSHTIKPLDEKAIIKSVKKTGAVVTVEEHQMAGGLGGAVAEALAKKCPTPMEMVGVDDRFGQSGSVDQLMTAFGLTDKFIIKAVKKVLIRKNI